MWRSPLAYGHATATRIFRRGLVRVTGVNDMESLSGRPPEAEPAADRERERDEGGEGGSDRSKREPPHRAAGSRIRRMLDHRRRQACDRVLIAALGGHVGDTG